jgi:catechol 2,3-dioxygenase
MIGTVSLTVADLDGSRAFYERVVGLRTLSAENETLRLGGEDGAPVLELVADPAAPARPPGTTGLFHFALLVPDRAELARSLHRVVEGGWRFTGASDHLVSEALYLRDPERNGIEIYRDRPREEWKREGGEIAMATLPLDLDKLGAEADGFGGTAMPAGTTMGHVHLNVADIGEADRFYAGGLGLDVTVRSYPGAIFFSSGGYHHHVAANTWAGEGAPAPPAGALGLRQYEIRLPDAEPATTRDPSGNQVRVEPDASAE